VTVRAAQVLYDLGVVSTPEPFQRLVSQGMILGEVEYTAFQDPDSGAWVPEDAPGAVPVRCAWAAVAAVLSGFWFPFQGVGERANASPARGCTNPVTKGGRVSDPAS
jgi:leucyl-tRNA synthetase